MGSPAAFAANAQLGALRPVACKPLAHDPAIEAPGWAQKEGANSSSDGWWCQLPHATEVPAGLVPFRRTLAPLPHLYAQYATAYAPKGTSPSADVFGPGQRSISVIPDASGAVNPVKVKRPNIPTDARTVTVATGVTGTVTDRQGTVSITWPYPTTGIPKYLQEVASVTVSGHGVPESIVLAVARHVKPD